MSGQQPYSHLIGKYITVHRKKVRITDIQAWWCGLEDEGGIVLPSVVAVRTKEGLFRLSPTGRVDQVISDDISTLIFRVGSHKFDLELNDEGKK